MDFFLYLSVSALTPAVVMADNVGKYYASAAK